MHQVMREAHPTQTASTLRSPLTRRFASTSPGGRGNYPLSLRERVGVRAVFILPLALPVLLA